MKQLAAFLVLIFVLGLGGFLYRNSVEQRGMPVAGEMCTQEARICPDGSSVGRSGPSCTFAACPYPNVELPSIHISFVVPAGFNKNTSAPTDSLVAAFEKGTTDPKDSLVVRTFPIPAGKTANDVMLGQTMYESSGNRPKSMQEFSPVLINGNTFQTITVERFEAQVHSLYYLPREHDVLRFEVIEHSVTNWTDPKLKVSDLPGHKALLSLLETLQNI